MYTFFSASLFVCIVCASAALLLFASILILLVNLCKHNKWFWSTSTDTDQFTIVFSCYAIFFLFVVIFAAIVFLLLRSPSSRHTASLSFPSHLLHICRSTKSLSSSPYLESGLLLPYHFYLVLFARYSSIQRIWKQGIKKTVEK